MILPGFTFDGQHSDSFDLNVLRVTWTAVAASRDVFEEVPGRPGTWHYPQPPGDRPLSIRAGIEADDQTDLHALVRAIAEWVRPVGRKRLILDDDPDYYWNAVLDNPGAIDHALDLGEFDLEFRCDPYVYALSETSASVTMGASGTVTVPLGVEVPARVVVKATGGSIVNPTVTIGDWTFSWTGTIASGSALVVDADTMVSGTTTDGAAALAGTLDLSTLTTQEITGDFVTLEPGANALTSSAGSGSIRVFWRPRRL